MEKRRNGYITDSISIFERVDGPTFAAGSNSTPLRRNIAKLFRRTGRILRTIDTSGMSHFDAKASNWIVRHDPGMGPSPVLIDTDAVRFRYWPGLGMPLLKEHAGTPAIHAAGFAGGCASDMRPTCAAPRSIQSRLSQPCDGHTPKCVAFCRMCCINLRLI